ncbi:hypothetical protein NIIDMKKI_10370 [Mycobacterium kansasii]|uniref:HTH tetR-type domain-containing protein n=1 Tax=Mycobacterium kansasii TaxID=1768 RepID=A0A7G1I4A5_MYCKA|nr:hypothetical protein NIIDMKKI_10370 [Mycobacterium kansasii]
MTEGEDRDNVLAAADRLFNDRGVQAVGIDDIRDAAGVPLKRLYREFPSKAHLVRAVLQRRDADIRQAIVTFVEARAAEPRFQILAVFDFLYEWFSQPDFRGCMFINTAGELGARPTTLPGSCAIISWRSAVTWISSSRPPGIRPC